MNTDPLLTVLIRVHPVSSKRNRMDTDGR